MLDDFADMNESDDVDPFAETANSRQVSSRESEYQRRRFDRGEGIQGASQSLVLVALLCLKDGL